MNLVLAIAGILAALLASTIAGYVSGYEASAEIDAQALFRHARPSYRNGKLYLQYVCDRRILAEFNVDSDNVTTSLATITSKAKNESKLSSIYQSAAIFLTGGGAAALVKEPIKKALTQGAKNNAKHVIPATIAAVTGFNLGYRIATWRSPECLDKRALEAIQDVEIWKTLKRTLAAHELLGRLSRVAERLGNDVPTLVEEKKLAAAQESIQGNKIDSETFKNLGMTDESRTVYNQEPFFSFDRIVTVFVPTLLMLGFAVFLAVVLTKKTVSHAKRKRTSRSTAVDLPN